MNRRTACLCRLMSIALLFGGTAWAVVAPERGHAVARKPGMPLTSPNAVRLRALLQSRAATRTGRRPGGQAPHALGGAVAVGAAPVSKARPTPSVSAGVAVLPGRKIHAAGMIPLGGQRSTRPAGLSGAQVRRGAGAPRQG